MNSLRYRPHFAWISAALMLTASFMALLAPRGCLAENKSDRQHLAPRLLAAFGEQSERFQGAGELQKYSGIAPVTERSGK